MRKIVILSLLCAAAGFAQSVSFGLIGGAPFQDVVKSTNTGGIQSIAKSTNFTIGPSFRVNLPASFRIEADALYRPYRFNLLAPFFSGPDVSANQWRFPILLQYRFKTPVLKPFIEGGLSFDHLSGISDAIKSVSSGPGKLLHSSDGGIVLGAGVDAKVPFVTVSGELRYTRQVFSNFSDISNLNQAEVLFGIRF